MSLLVWRVGSIESSVECSKKSVNKTPEIEIHKHRRLKLAARANIIRGPNCVININHKSILKKVNFKEWQGPD